MPKILIETQQHGRWFNLARQEIVKQFERKLFDLLLTDEFAKKFVTRIVDDGGFTFKRTTLSFDYEYYGFGANGEYITKFNEFAEKVKDLKDKNVRNSIHIKVVE